MLLTRTRLSEVGALPGAPPPRWQVLLAAALGAAHETDGRPLQDALTCVGDPSVPGNLMAVAVADGHGHPRHARSARGAALAVAVAARAAVEQGSHLAGATMAQAACAAARSTVIPVLIERWRQAVADDLADHPPDAAETQLLRPGDEPLVLYGTTLLLGVVAFPWLALCQIGDGDIMVANRDGQVQTPVPVDDQLDGWRTTSLCQPDAERSFRCGVVDLAHRPVVAVLLATDGFGNAQAADPWQQPVGADLVTFARERGIAWMREQLPVWVARCASAEGSADDTAVALLLSDDLLRVPTVPVVPTVPAQYPGMSQL
jgi:Protein phosphatase 2C